MPRGVRALLRRVAAALAVVAAVPAPTWAGGGATGGQIDLVTAIGLAVVSAAALSILFHAFKQPALLAYIVAGLLMQMGLTSRLGDSLHVMETVSHLGLVFLLFIIGIEMDLRGIQRLGRRTAAVLLLQAPLAAAAVLALQWLFARAGLVIPGLGGSADAWFYYGVVVALSSTAVVVKLLSDKFDLTSQAGKLSVLTLIAQDIWAVLALSYVTIRGGDGGSTLWLMLAGGGGAFAGIVVVARWALEPLLARLTRSPDLVALVALGWCFLCAESMKAIGFSAEMGALLAGLTIGRMPIHTEILAKVVNLRDFFMALFFVALGISLPSPSLDMLLRAAPLVAIVALARLLLFAPALLAARQGPIVALGASINLAQISEFSLLLIPIGVAQGALSRSDVGVINYAMMLSVLLSTYAIRYNYDLAILLGGWLGLGRAGGDRPQPGRVPGGSGGPEKAEVILLGYYHNAAALAALAARSDPELLRRVLVVDYNLRAHGAIRAAGMRVVYGDISNPETLRHCGIDRARVVVSTLNDTFLRGIGTSDLLELVGRINPEARFIATAVSAREATALEARGAWACIVPESEAAPAYLQAIRTALD